MTIVHLLLIACLVLSLVIASLWVHERLRRLRLSRQFDETEAILRATQEELVKAAPYLAIVDAEGEGARVKREAEEAAARIQREAVATLESAKAEATALLAQANEQASGISREIRERARERQEAAEEQLRNAGEQARRIIQEAERRAAEISGDAYAALRDAKHYEQVVDAMRNKIEGYGDRYIVPSYSILGELAETYGFAEAGRELKLARERSSVMVEHGRAADCDYVEKNRRDTAIHFVLDAFNGKVDSILSRTKSDNIGTLTQQIRDAYALVNYNGQAFRSARITEEYLDARLEELKWAAAVVALRDRDREEQRAIKARIREEERAQREFERAKREAEREEAAVRKAMARMEEALAKAKDEQKQQYEEQLEALKTKLAEAEEKGQRALSMAQLTKSGHIYVISNVGSFGENVYKIGMTRRLEPLDRIRELGDASVPFAFDVHALVYAEDAPAVERSLHRLFLEQQVNKVNPRKEFFRIPISALKTEVDNMGLQCSWTLAAEAAEYRETLAINTKISIDVGARLAWVEEQSKIDPVVMSGETDDGTVREEAINA